VFFPHIKVVVYLFLAFSIVGLVFPQTTFAEHLLFKPDHPKGGWRGFGVGYDDSTVNLRKNEIQIIANWKRATWGVGMMFSLDQPIDGKGIKAIRAKVKSSNGSPITIFAGLSTKNDANIEVPRNKALEITNKWQIFEFPVREMVPLKPSHDAPLFSDSDWQKIQLIKLIITKPATTTISEDVIFVRNPEFVLLK